MFSVFEMRKHNLNRSATVSRQFKRINSKKEEAIMGFQFNLDDLNNPQRQLTESEILYLRKKYDKNKTKKSFPMEDEFVVPPLFSERNKQRRKSQ